MKLIMRAKYLILSLFLLISCGTNNTDSSNDESTFSSESQNSFIEEKDVENALNLCKKSFSTLIEKVNVKQYLQTQVDNYFAVEVTASQRGEVKLYQDNFSKDNFTQTFEDDSSNQISGTNEKGICKYQNKDVFYSVIDYTNDKENSSVKLYEYDESLLDSFFSLSFKQQYFSFLDITSTYFNTYKDKGYLFTLNTNIFSLDFSKDGEKKIEFLFKIESKSSGVVLEIKRDDTINISNLTTTTSESSYYLSLEGGINYSSVILSATYDYIELGNYIGQRLNPLDYLN